MDNLEKKLREATLNPTVAIEVASDLAINYLGDAHEKADNLRVEVAKSKIKMREDSPKMSMAETDMRIEATDLFREYLRAKHFVERVEEYIRVAKAHAKISGGF